MKYSVAIVLLMGVLLAGVPALAQSPTPRPTSTPIPSLTPSPTLKALQPTKTSIYLYLRPSPTMFTIPEGGPQLEILMNPDDMADSTINFYRYANRDHVIDLIITLISVGFGIIYLVRITRRVQNKDGKDK